MPDLVGLLEQRHLAEGFSCSPLAGVRFFKSTTSHPRTPIVYQPGFYIVAQGTKRGYIGDKSFCYDANNYLVTSVTLPFECETIVGPDGPLLGLYISIDVPQLHTLLSHMGPCTRGEAAALPRAIGPTALTKAMRESIIRLLRCLQSEVETRVLAAGLIREIHFHALQGSQAATLYALAAHAGKFGGVAHALNLIHQDYAADLHIERLARQAHMSPSAFHRAFKEVTGDSPIQYLKKVRLDKGRHFLVHEKMKVYLAAARAGYASPSQFSREFKRYFGESPADTLRSVF